MFVQFFYFIRKSCKQRGKRRQQRYNRFRQGQHLGLLSGLVA